MEELSNSEVLVNSSILPLNDTPPFMTLEEIQDYIFPKSWTWVLILMHAVVFLIGLFGNIMVCVAVYRNHTMRTVTNYFIVNLAVADTLVILFCLPFSVVWDVTSTWFFGTAMCKFVLYVQNVSVTVSILTLAFISGDRWYAICYPLRFKSTTARAKTAIFVIWVIAVTCGGCKHALAFLMWMYRRTEEPSPTEVTSYWKKPQLSGVGTSLKFTTATEFMKKSVNRPIFDASSFRNELTSVGESSKLTGNFF